MSGWRSLRGCAVVVAALVPSTVATTWGTDSLEAAPATSRFVAVAVRQLVDTSVPDVGFDRLDPSTVRVPVVEASEVPADASAVVLSIDASEAVAAGHVIAYPSGAGRPGVSMVNVTPAVPAVSTTVVQLGVDGSVDVFHAAPMRLRVAVLGYFVGAVSATDGRFVAMAHRVLDTRSGARVAANAVSRVELPVPDDASAVVLDVVAVLSGGAGSVRVGPEGADTAEFDAVRLGTGGATRAGFAVVQVRDGAVQLRPTVPTHLVVDLVGYFTGPSAADASHGLFVPMEPQRLRDTRTTPPRLWTNGTLEIPFSTAEAGSVWAGYVAVAAYGPGHLITWPAGTARPGVSTLNTIARATVANASITALSDRGLAVHSTTETHLIVDAFGWFTGDRASATLTPLPNDKYPYVLAPGKGQVALTFDDGPHPVTTPMVVSILERARVGGTFFVIGGLADLYPAVAASAFHLGHSIQSHTYSHRRLRSLTSAGVIEELRHANRIITRITGRTPATYRPPYGSTDSRVRAASASIGMREIMWNASPGMMSPAEEMVAMIRSQALSARARGVGLTVLFHDGSGCRGCTVKALPIIIDILKSQGWKFVVIG